MYVYHFMHHCLKLVGWVCMQVFALTQARSHNLLHSTGISHSLSVCYTMFCWDRHSMLVLDFKHTRAHTHTFLATPLFLFHQSALRSFRLGSPQLKYIIGAGAVLQYLGVYFMAFPSTDPTRVAVSCNVRMHIYTLVCRVMCEKFVCIYVMFLLVRW